MSEPTQHMTRPRWALLGSLYVTQYFGTSFFIVALVAILRRGGETLETVSVVYMLGLVWALKFLWAPWVDRWRSRRFGHYRAWLIAMQVIMVTTLLLIGRFDPVNDFSAVYALCLLLALAAATQDVATDGLAYRLIPPRDRGTANGVQAAGGLLGNLLGAGGVVMAYSHVGWAGCTFILALGTAVSLLQLLAFREPAHPAAVGQQVQVFRRLRALFLQPGQRRWLAMVLFYPMGVSLGYALITPILVDAGWALERIGLAVNVVGSLCGIPAALLTGHLIRRVGIRPVLIGAALLQVPGVLILSLPLAGYTDTLPVMFAVGLFFACYNPAVTLITTLMMGTSDPGSPATDYALQYSLYMLFSIVAVTLGTSAAGQLGYIGVLAIAAACALAMLPLALKQRVGADSTQATKTASAVPLVAPQAQSDLLLP